MEIKQVRESLLRVFEEEKKRIVFWYDSEGEFEGILPALGLDGISIVRLDEIGSLALKVRLEIEDPEGRFLVYSPQPEPHLQEDWLLDIRLFSKTFHADRASVLLNELGLKQQSLRPFLTRRKKFFQNRERLNRLKKWVSPEDDEGDLDLKMLAVVVKADQPEIFSILMKLFSEDMDALAGGSPERSAMLWGEVEKLDLETIFWESMASTFGYLDPSPKLSDLLIRLLVTDFAHNLDEDTPVGLKHFLIASAQKAFNASVFLSQWRSHMAYFKSYDRLSRYFAKQLKLEEYLQPFGLEALRNVMTFELVEQKIIRLLRDMLTAGDPDGFEASKEIIRRRCDGHWVNTLLHESKQANLYRAAYEAMLIASELFRLRGDYDPGLSYPTPEAMFEAYTRELYRFDQCYRKFHEASGKVEMGGWDVLKSLRDNVEDSYGGWFLDQVAVTWGGFLDQGEGRGLLQQWFLPGVRNQNRFFAGSVDSILQASSRNRAFVIISDAFRYEAAEELMRQINGKYRFKAKLDAMLGVLPSSTSLGMAALLPHGKLAYKEDGTGEVLVDGQMTASLEQRAKLLAAREGTAIRAEELMAMSKEQGRELVKPYRVVYIYHNRVDAIGDKAVTESQVFEAVGKSIEELEALAAFIINSLNGTVVLLTADHGFIYQEKPPTAIDKSALTEKPSSPMVAKKRFILGRELGESGKAWHGFTRKTGGTDDDIEFWIPKGTNRFHFAGGSRFYHGGAMLQEIIIPVLEIREVKGKGLNKTQVRKVGVSLLGSVKKIVNNIHRFEFIQTDAVSERVQPLALLLSLRDESELISNEETVTFDSRSSSMDKRKKSVKLTVKGGSYDSKKEYFLVLRDAETLIEYERIPLFIDLAFTKDF